MPRTGTFTFWNIARPLRASMSATSCGVVTMTAPESATFCVSVSCASPVPGGRSTSRKSCFPHATSPRNCSTALKIIGPRQITGVSTSIRKPMDMTRTPKRSIGRIFSSSFTNGFVVMPIIICCDGP